MSCAARKCTYRVVRKGLCAAHASKAEHPGRVLYLGRWRTPEEVAVRIISDQSMRGVKWAIESGVLIGRQNGFEMRLPYCDPHSVLRLCPPSFDERDLLPASDYFEKLNTDEWPFIQPPPKKETP